MGIDSGDTRFIKKAPGEAYTAVLVPTHYVLSDLNEAKAVE